MLSICVKRELFISRIEGTMMFEGEKQRINEYRNSRIKLQIVWAIVKLAVAYALVTYIDFGFFIVFGYILYSLEKTSGLQFINTQETDLQLNILNQRISELEGKQKKGE